MKQFSNTGITTRTTVGKTNMLRRSFVSFVFCHASPPYTGVGVKFEKGKRGKKIKSAEGAPPYWGRSAWRTPKNVCVGGYYTLDSGSGGKLPETFFKGPGNDISA